MSTPDLSTSKNHTTESLEKSCGECCGSTLPKAVCCWRSSHSIHAQKLIVRVGGVLSQLPWVLDSDKVLSPLLFVVYMSWIGSHSQVDDGVADGGFRINRLFVC